LLALANEDRFAPLLAQTLTDAKKRKLGHVVDEQVKTDDNTKLALTLNYKLDFEDA